MRLEICIPGCLTISPIKQQEMLGRDTWLDHSESTRSCEQTRMMSSCASVESCGRNVSTWRMPRICLISQVASEHVLWTQNGIILKWTRLFICLPPVTITSAVHSSYHQELSRCLIVLSCLLSGNLSQLSLLPLLMLSIASYPGNRLLLTLSPSG